MNLKREYDAAVLGILQSDGERIAELEAERDELREKLANIDKYILCEKDNPIVLGSLGARWVGLPEGTLLYRAATEPKP